MSGQLVGIICFDALGVGFFLVMIFSRRARRRFVDWLGHHD